MGVEIERKFLVGNDDWLQSLTAEPKPPLLFKQGYLSSDPEATVRVRLEGDKGKLTIKGKSKGIARAEFEYEIPADDALQLLTDLCSKPLIEKTRHYRMEQGLLWEIDVFENDNKGLVLAEVELSSESQAIELPSWVGEEVSSDSRYYNVNLVSNPFKLWGGE